MRLAKLIKRSFCFFVLFFLGAYCFPRPVQANDSFDVSLSSTYTVQTNGTAVIEQQFTLTNKTPTLYASQYAIEVGLDKIQNVKVFDKNGKIPANIVSTDKKTSVAIEFENVIVGEGKKRQFTVQFESSDIANISGNVVEVYVPRFSDLAHYDHYTVQLRVPEQFGPPVRVNPPATSSSNSDGFSIMNFDGLGDRGVTALFGEKQIYDFTLRYHLENPTNSIGIAQIALPPDTGYQKISYINIDPKPKTLSRDQDGNWIGTYEVSAGRETEVLLSGKAYIYLSTPAGFVDQSPTKDHLAAQRFWQTTNPRILEIAQENPNPRMIYDFVVKTLAYNFNKTNGPVTRLGAVAALEQPQQAACQEFTDLFITLCRAEGVPARRVTGYSYTENNRLRPLSFVDDVLHAWPEYFDRLTQRWVAVDPTWGNTTGGLDYFSQLDFNHVAFAINGVSDTTPYPAGSYKRTVGQTKDVEVTFGKDELLPELLVGYTITKRPFWLAPFQNVYDIEISNQTGVAWYNLPIKAQLGSSGLNVSQFPATIPLLLPYQNVKVPLKVGGIDWISREPFVLTLTLKDLSSTHALKSGIELLETIKSAPINPVSLGTGLVIVTIITGCLLVLRRKR